MVKLIPTLLKTGVMGNFCLSGGVPGLTDINEALCPICKTEVKDLNYFIANCPNSNDQFKPLWTDLDPNRQF